MAAKKPAKNISEKTSKSTDKKSVAKKTSKAAVKKKPKEEVHSYNDGSYCIYQVGCNCPYCTGEYLKN